MVECRVHLKGVNGMVYLDEDYMEEHTKTDRVYSKEVNEDLVFRRILERLAGDLLDWLVS
jgi:hypothetical protein